MKIITQQTKRLKRLFFLPLAFGFFVFSTSPAYAGAYTGGSRVSVGSAQALAASEIAVGADDESTPASATYDPDNMIPFSGTGSTVNISTSGDGKEFFTITAIDGSVFYLVIDKQKGAENVYFLNTVTIDDLKSLAEGVEGKSSDVSVGLSMLDKNTTIKTRQIETDDESGEDEADKTEDSKEESSPGKNEAAVKGSGSNILVVIIILVVGAAGYYFKIYRPKHDTDDADDLDDLLDDDFNGEDDADSSLNEEEAVGDEIFASKESGLSSENSENDTNTEDDDEIEKIKSVERNKRLDVLFQEDDDIDDEDNGRPVDY